MKKNILQSFAWNSFSNYANLIIIFIGTIILSRLLEPADFGIIGYIISIYSISLIFIGWGAAPYLIKTKHNIQEVLQTVTTIQIASNIIIFFIVVSCYQLIFTEASPQHFLLFMTIGIAQIIRSFSTPALGMLQRSLQFKKISLTVLISSSISLVAAAAIAYSTHSIWALVAFYGIPELLQGMTYLIISPTKPKKLRIIKKELHHYYDYAKYNFLSLLFDRTYRQTDDIIVKNSMGVERLGYYTQAYRISELFTNITWGSIGQVSNSLFGKYKDNKDILNKNYNIFTSATMRAITFLYLPFLLLATRTVTFIYGDKWLPIVPIIYSLSLFALLTPYRRIHREFLLYTGRSKEVAKAQGYEVGTFLITIIPGTLFWGIYGVAGAITIGLISGIIVMLIQLRHHLDFQLRKVFVPIIIAGIGASIIYELTNKMLQITNSFLYLAVHASIISLIYLTILYIQEPQRLKLYLKHIMDMRKSFR